MLPPRVNVSEKVAALEALLEKVQRNAAKPRPGRSSSFGGAPAGAPIAAATEDKQRKAAPVAGASTAPYPVAPAAIAAPSTAPATDIGDRISPLPFTPGAPTRDVTVSNVAAVEAQLTALDMEPASYPTLPGIAVPRQPISAPSGMLPKVPPVVAPSPQPPAAKPVATGAIATRPAAAKPPEARPAPSPSPAPVAPVKPVVATPALTPAAAKAPAVVSPAGTKAPLAPKLTPKESPAVSPAAASPAAASPAAKPAGGRSVFGGKTLLGGITPTAAKAPSVTTPAAPKPNLTTPTGKLSPAEVSKSPLAPAVADAASPAAAPVAAKAATPSEPKAAKPADPTVDVEVSVEWTANPPRALPDLLEETADGLVGFDPTAEPVPTAKSTQGAAAPLAKAPSVAVAASGLPRATVDEEEDQGDEPTVLRASAADVDRDKLAAIERAESSRAESSDEPTVLRLAPSAVPSSIQDSSDEPTVLRAAAQDKDDKAPEDAAAAPVKRSEEATNRNIRVALAPEVIAQAAAEIEARAERQERPPGSEEVTSLTRAPSEMIGQDEQAVDRRKPRTASLWGIFAAAIVLAAGGVILAKQKGWIPGGLPWAPPTGVVTSSPTTPPTLGPVGPSTVAPIVTTSSPSADVADAGVAEPTEITDAGALADAGELTDAAADAATATDAATAAGAGADAGADTDAGAPADAGAATPPPVTSAEPTAPPSEGGAPPKDPKTLPDKKGYLMVTTPAPLAVFVMGTFVGMTNQWAEADCGLKFMRIGEVPGGGPPASGNVGVKWRSAGQPTSITCRGQTTVAVAPSP